MASKYKYPLKPKVQFYPDELTLAKFKRLAKNEKRSESSMANHIIYQAVKDVKLEEKPTVDINYTTSYAPDGKIANIIKQ